MGFLSQQTILYFSIPKTNQERGFLLVDISFNMYGENNRFCTSAEQTEKKYPPPQILSNGLPLSKLVNSSETEYPRLLTESSRLTLLYLFSQGQTHD